MSQEEGATAAAIPSIRFVRQLRCMSCKKPEPAEYICPGCHHAIYCSEECQRHDWDYIHKHHDHHLKSIFHKLTTGAESDDIERWDDILDDDESEFANYDTSNLNEDNECMWIGALYDTLNAKQVRQLVGQIRQECQLNSVDNGQTVTLATTHAKPQKHGWLKENKKLVRRRRWIRQALRRPNDLKLAAAHYKVDTLEALAAVALNKQQWVLLHQTNIARALSGQFV
jgi:hypothetical protein